MRQFLHLHLFFLRNFDFRVLRLGDSSVVTSQRQLAHFCTIS